MARLLKKLWDKHPSLYLFHQLFSPRLSFHRGGLQSIHDKFIKTPNDATIAVDLGCGPTPLNRFQAATAYGVDLYEDDEKRVIKCQLGFESLPFDDNSIDYLTAYDLLEHIPRYATLPEHGNTPFIFLMNECDRVLKPGGVFLSMTPVYPFFGAFQDPTHNNIMTIDTFKLYFSNEKYSIASHYGITTDFKIRFQRMLGQHHVCVLEK